MFFFAHASVVVDMSGLWRFVAGPVVGFFLLLLILLQLYGVVGVCCVCGWKVCFAFVEGWGHARISFKHSWAVIEPAVAFGGERVIRDA